VLVGQLNLQPLLKAPQMRQLDQRVSIRYELKPLTCPEVAAYVLHRLTVGGSAAVSFQPKALDLVHKQTAGIPRLVNLLCDRALLAAYSSRTNKVTPDMVQKAAESLELVTPHTSRFSWFRKRASVVVTAAGATVSLAAAGGMLAPVARAAANQSRPAEGIPAVPAAPVARIPQVPPVAALNPINEPAAADPRYAVLAASFPVADVTGAGSAARARLDAVTAQLQALGYAPRIADVDLKERGEWRRVLIGEFATLDDAADQAAQLHQTKAFADAYPIRY
jgi:general secretion pathway protein A